MLEEGDPVQLLFETLSIRRTVKALVEAHDPPRGKDRLALLDHADRDGVVRLFVQGWVVKNKTVWVLENAHPKSPFYGHPGPSLADPFRVGFENRTDFLGVWNHFAFQHPTANLVDLTFGRRRLTNGASPDH